MLDAHTKTAELGKKINFHDAGKRRAQRELIKNGKEIIE
jgi:hypothetical protein